MDGDKFIEALNQEIIHSMPKPMQFIAIVEGADGVRYGGDEEGSLWRLDKLKANGIPYKILKPGREWVKTLKPVGLAMVVIFFIVMTVLFLAEF